MSATSPAASGARWRPRAVSAARSCVAGRKHPQRQTGAAGRDRRQAPRAAGPRTRRRRCPSAGRRPRAAHRRAADRRPTRAAGPTCRTAASSANRMSLRRNPFPSSTHTASGAVTSTSVVPSAHSSGSRMPAPVSSVCSTRRLVQHLGVAEHPAGFGANRGGDHVGPQRGGLGSQPLAHAFDQRRRSCRPTARPSRRVAAPPAPGGPPPQRGPSAPGAARRVRAARPVAAVAASPPAAAAR